MADGIKLHMATVCLINSLGTCSWLLDHVYIEGFEDTQIGDPEKTTGNMALKRKQKCASGAIQLQFGFFRRHHTMTSALTAVPKEGNHRPWLMMWEMSTAQMDATAEERGRTISGQQSGSGRNFSDQLH